MSVDDAARRSFTDALPFATVVWNLVRIKVYKNRRTPSDYFGFHVAKHDCSSINKPLIESH